MLYPSSKNRQFSRHKGKSSQRQRSCLSHIHSPTRGYRYTIRRGSGLFILCQAFGDASEELDKNIVPRLFIFINVCSGTGSTRTKIMYKYLKPIMMLAIASVLFTSCGGDDPDNPADPGNTTETAVPPQILPHHPTHPSNALSAITLR